MNRYWQSLFGRGLVATPEDFGAQGQWPSHPELLDWLARDFVDSGWDIKRLVKRILMSGTYQQSSHITPELRSGDVVAIMSNGGFGGIHDKILSALRSE